MTLRALVQLDKKDFFRRDVSLRSPVAAVTDFGYEFQQLVDDLIETLNHHQIAVGLAAPQINIGKQVVVINLSPDKKEPTLVLVNPRIISTSGKKDTKKESCMSLPHFRGAVERRYKCQVEFQDRHGQKHILNAKGFLARVIAHEVDHLQGVLYVDHMDDEAKLEPVDFFEED